MVRHQASVVTRPQGSRRLREALLAGMVALTMVLVGSAAAPRALAKSTGSSPSIAFEVAVASAGAVAVDKASKDVRITVTVFGIGEGQKLNYRATYVAGTSTFWHRTVTTAGTVTEGVNTMTVARVRAGSHEVGLQHVGIVLTSPETGKTMYSSHLMTKYTSDGKLKVTGGVAVRIRGAATLRTRGVVRTSKGKMVWGTASKDLVGKKIQVWYKNKNGARAKLLGMTTVKANRSWTLTSGRIVKGVRINAIKWADKSFVTSSSPWYKVVKKPTEGTLPRPLTGAVA